MSTEVKIPSVGESVSSGVISRWHKSGGEFVKTGDVLLTLETDKVSTEVTAEADGVVELLAPEGREVRVGEVVARILDGSDAPGEAGAGDDRPAPPEQAAAGEPVGQAAPRPEIPAAAGDAPSEAEPASPQPSGAEAADDTGIGRHGPAAARVMRQEGIDPSEVDIRSGPGSRITRDDLGEFLKRRADREAAAATHKPQAASDEAEQAGAPGEAAAPASRPPVEERSAPPSAQLAAPSPAGLAPVSHGASAEAVTTRKPMSPLRKKIAQQLVNAQRQAALLTTFNECDMSAVIAIRSRMQESFTSRHGTKLGFMSFFVKAVVNALQEVPAVNARIDGDDIVQHHYYDIGVAVGTERGLVVPVLRRADTKSFAALEKEMGEFAARARDGKIQIDDLRGGVFTITNGGIYGSLMSTPIVNPPQSAILGMHAIKERPVVVDGEIVVRPMMYLALTYDHRVIDGREAVTFLVRVREAIEDPMQLIL